MPDTAPLLDARGLAKLLNISVPSVWRWVANGTLPPAIRLSAQCLRWHPGDIAAFLEAKRQEAANNNGPDDDRASMDGKRGVE